MDSLFAFIHGKNQGVPDGICKSLGEFIGSIDQYASDSTARYLGLNFFAIYDHPPTERWAKECSWHVRFYRLADTSFDLIQFEESAGSIEFKLRWC